MRRPQLVVVAWQLASLGCGAPTAGPGGGTEPAGDVVPVAVDARAPSAPADLGAADAPAKAPPDGAPDAASFAPCRNHPGALCDDFEEPAVGKPPAAPWKVTGSATLVIDDQRARSGTKSVHVKVDPTHNRVYMTETSTFPMANDTLYIRFFVYFAQQIAPEPNNSISKAKGDYVHWNIAQTAGPYPYDGKVYTPRLNLFGGENQHIFTNLNAGPFGADIGGYDSKPPPGQGELPAGKWICFEMMARTTPPETRLWWDGVEHPSLHLQDMVIDNQKQKVPFTVPKFASLHFGWDDTGTFPGDSLEFWLDDVGIASERIGCAL